MFIVPGGRERTTAPRSNRHRDAKNKRRVNSSRKHSGRRAKAAPQGSSGLYSVTTVNKAVGGGVKPEYLEDTPTTPSHKKSLSLSLIIIIILSSWRPATFGSLNLSVRERLPVANGNLLTYGQTMSQRWSGCCWNVGDPVFSFPVTRNEPEDDGRRRSVLFWVCLCVTWARSSNQVM